MGCLGSLGSLGSLGASVAVVQGRGIVPAGVGHRGGAGSAAGLGLGPCGHGVLRQNVGMNRARADKSPHPRGPRQASARLRDAGVGAFFRPRQLRKAGLSSGQLPALLRAGLVERVQRGLYRIASSELTEDYSLAMTCARVPRSIVCLLSALRVHGIGTQAPAEVWLAIPHKARAPRFTDLRVRIVRFSGPAWSRGVVSTTFEGVPAHITSPARTVVDCFRFEGLVGPEVAMEALADALHQRKTTVAELGRIERAFPTRRLRAALDVRSI